jgi:GNAT superfamily N-acetyltransferase
LLPERAKAIDPRRGVFFKRGEAEFFLAYRGNRLVGTICAAEDRVTNQQRGARDGMFGFFEVIDDYSVAEALWGRAAEWAAKRGLETLYGPFNLDYEDGYGVLLEGRDRPPALMCGHTPPYYLPFFERYGFSPARGDNLAYAIDVRAETPALRQLSRLAERARQRGSIRVREANLQDWDGEIERVHRLLNTALAHLPDFIPWQREAVAAMFAPFRDLVDPELVLFAESGDQTIGFLPGLPNYNEALIRVNGLRYPWDYFSLWRAMRQPIRSLTVKSVLVLPEYWGVGAGLLLFDEMLQRIRQRGYAWVDLSLTSDDNPRTPMLAERLGARIYKRYRVFRKRI